MKHLYTVSMSREMMRNVHVRYEKNWKYIVWDVQSSFEELRKSNHKLQQKFYASAPLTQGVYGSHGHAFPKGQISTNGVLILLVNSSRLFPMMAGILYLTTPIEHWMFIPLIHFGTQRPIASCPQHTTILLEYWKEPLAESSEDSCKRWRQ